MKVHKWWLVKSDMIASKWSCYACGIKCITPKNDIYHDDPNYPSSDLPIGHSDCDLEIVRKVFET